MRYLDLIEARPPPGMLAVKAALQAKIADRSLSPEDHEKLLNQWGIIDDLWIEPSGGLALYRALRLKQPWEQHLQRRGHPYWSTSKQGAEPYNAMDASLKDAADVRIGALLSSRANVDWFDIWETILHYHDVGENELRLESGIPLTIFEVWVDGRMEHQSPLIRQRLIS